MIRRFEQRSTVALLGIRFWDAALDRAISDGLEVLAVPADAGRATAALRTPSGIYAFHALPGMRAAVWPDRPDETPAPRDFTLEVRDRLGRFLPTAFAVTLPLPYRGIYPVDDPNGPLGSSPSGLLLFASPGRKPPAGLAAVRAQLVDAGGAPAAHAVLEIETGGRVFLGVADWRGCVLALFAYPRLPASIAGSLPGPPPESQRWPLRLRVRYERGAGDAPAEGAAPDARRVLGQGPGQIWPASEGPPVDEWEAQLGLGEELVLRSAQEPVRSTLIVSPGGSL
jgi:hypothetical protein